ncbi:MAG: hypothetical protein JNL05_10785 [Flavobacteriales bacterium]|nr:hypothetical protein [Flavobacteriales bacterium]
MRPLLALLLLFSLSTTTNAQTVVRITNLTITEKEVATPGPELSSQLKGAEGSERVVLFSDGPFSIRTWFKVSTHKSPRSSTKDSAVNLIMELDLLENGKKKDNRRVEKIFYMDQARTTTYNEKFVIKKGIDVRVIHVKFDATIE